MTEKWASGCLISTDQTSNHLFTTTKYFGYFHCVQKYGINSIQRNIYTVIPLSMNNNQQNSVMVLLQKQAQAAFLNDMQCNPNRFTGWM